MRKTLTKFYDFTTMRPLNQRLVGSAIALILVGGIYIVGTGVFNTVQDSLARAAIQREIDRQEQASPKEWLNFYSVKVDDAPLGEKPLLTLCRKLGHGSIKIDAVRTFIVDPSGQQKQVNERAFTAAIEQSVNGTDCTSVDLQGQPQIAGEYQILTEYCFRTPDHNVKKCDSYRSNEYKMTDDLQQLKNEIERLQKEYDRRSNGGTVDPAPIEDQPSSSSTQQSSTSGSTSSQQSSGNGSNSNSSSNNGSGNSGGNSSSSGATIDLPLLPAIKIGD